MKIAVAVVWIHLVVVAYALSEDASLSERKVLQELAGNVSIFTIEPKQNNLLDCPSKCCKRYCKDGISCAPAVAPARLPTCTSGSDAKDSGQCYSPETSGCAANQCKARANCRTNCGIVMEVIEPAFCP